MGMSAALDSCTKEWNAEKSEVKVQPDLNKQVGSRRFDQFTPGKPVGADGRTAAEMIRTEGLVKRYGKVTALDGLDLEVPRGTVLGLLGPNG
ncbi:MAG: hypothetical protein M3214_03550, partial [Actinomycetota bacterium]|nr:hypothetical protein [Actinomycetota bacterium]